MIAAQIKLWLIGMATAATVAAVLYAGIAIRHGGIVAERGVWHRALATKNEKISQLNDHIVTEMERKSKTRIEYVEKIKIETVEVPGKTVYIKGQCDLSPADRADLKKLKVLP